MRRLGPAALLLVWLAAPAHAEPAKCDDQALLAKVEETWAAVNVYMTALEKRSGKWKTDCEVARKDLVALEPAATTYYEAVLAAKAWAESLEPACRERVKELGKKHFEGPKLDRRAKALEAKVKPMLERCKNHPGFAQAASKGLRVMKRRKT